MRTQRHWQVDATIRTDDEAVCIWLADLRDEADAREYAAQFKDVSYLLDDDEAEELLYPDSEVLLTITNPAGNVIEEISLPRK